MRWRRASNEEYRSAPLRHHRCPGRDRKGDHGLRAQQGRVQGRRQGNQAANQGSLEKLFDVKVKSVNTLVRKGKTKVFRGQFGSQSDVKRAIVTLEEGHRIDVTTGL